MCRSRGGRPGCSRAAGLSSVRGGSACPREAGLLRHGAGFAPWRMAAPCPRRPRAFAVADGSLARSRAASGRCWRRRACLPVGGERVLLAAAGLPSRGRRVRAVGDSRRAFSRATGLQSCRQRGLPSRRRRAGTAGDSGRARSRTAGLQRRRQPGSLPGSEPTRSPTEGFPVRRLRACALTGAIQHTRCRGRSAAGVFSCGWAIGTPSLTDESGYNVGLTGRSRRPVPGGWLPSGTSRFPGSVISPRAGEIAPTNALANALGEKGNRDGRHENARGLTSHAMYLLQRNQR